MNVETVVRHASRAPYTVSLDDDEWRLVRSLRELPPSPLRDHMNDLIESLVAFVQSPGCPEAQADGVPCTSVEMACDRCRRVLDVFDEVRARFPHVRRRTS